jgi:hypothetical protein
MQERTKEGGTENRKETRARKWGNCKRNSERKARKLRKRDMGKRENGNFRKERKGI